MNVIIHVADSSHLQLAQEICDLVFVSAQARGTGIAKRSVDYIEENEVDIGIICTSKDSAQEVADRMCFAGVKGIWNFAPVDIEVPSKVSIEHVHLSDSLHSLAYHMSKK